MNKLVSNIQENIYRIKDSIDIFLTDQKFITVYYMATRQRKTFQVNELMVRFLELLDGKKTIKEIQNILSIEYEDFIESSVGNIIALLEQYKIITQPLLNQHILSPDDVSRYTRQLHYFTELLLDEEQAWSAQASLFQKKVVIFGCGAIGGNIALELCMAGIRHFTLMDYDVVQPSDVARHLFFKEKYIGQFKTSSLRETLEDIDPKVHITCIDNILHPTDDIESIIKEADFVINTMDEPYIGYTAAKISRVCMKYHVAHFIAGGFDAHLASTGELIIPYKTPCVECYTSHFKVVLKNWKPLSHPVKKLDTQVGGLPSMSLFSSSYACLEILKYLIGYQPEQYKARGEFLFDTMDLTYLDIKANPDCPICNGDL